MRSELDNSETVLLVIRGLDANDCALKPVFE